MKTKTQETKKVHTVKQLLTAVACALSVSLLSGCLAAAAAGAAAGGGAFVYVNGAIKALEAQDVDTVWKATLAGFEDMNLLAEAKHKDAFEAKCQAYGPGDKIVRVHIERQNKDVTEIKIRVGWFGDREFSEELLNKIRSHYPETPPQG